MRTGAVSSTSRPTSPASGSGRTSSPNSGLVCAGKHLGGGPRSSPSACCPPSTRSPAAPGTTEDFRDEELSPVERDVAEALLETGPLSTAELPELAGHERKRVSAATHRLQRRLVLTAAGRQERERGWPAVVLDLLPRRYGHRLHDLPAADEARAPLVGVDLRSPGEVSAADSPPSRGPRKQAGEALDRLADEGKARSRDADGYMLWAL